VRLRRAALLRRALRREYKLETFIEILLKQERKQKAVGSNEHATSKPISTSEWTNGLLKPSNFT